MDRSHKEDPTRELERFRNESEAPLPFYPEDAWHMEDPSASRYTTQYITRLKGEFLPPSSLARPAM